MNWNYDAILEDRHRDFDYFLLTPEIVAVLFNVIVVLATFKSKELRTYQSFLIINLAIYDILSSLTLTATFIYIFRKESISEYMCKYQGTVVLGTIAASGAVLCAIARDRYLVIVKNDRNRKNARTTIGVILCNAIPIISCLLPHAGVGSYTIHPNGLCMPDWPDSGALPLAILFILVQIIEVILMIVCYYRIFQISHRANAAVIPYQLQNGHGEVGVTEERKLSRKMFALVVAFILCFLCQTLVIIYETCSGQYASYTFDVIAWGTALLNPLLNPILYSLADVRYRRAIFELCPTCVQSALEHTVCCVSCIDEIKRNNRSPKPTTNSRRTTDRRGSNSHTQREPLHSREQSTLAIANGEHLQLSVPLHTENIVDHGKTNPASPTPSADTSDPTDSPGLNEN